MRANVGRSSRRVGRAVTVLVAGSVLWIASPSPGAGQTSEDTRPALELVVTIAGMDDPRGELRIAVFDNAESFTVTPLTAAVVPVESAEQEWRITLPAGTYALAIIHDKDANGELNTNFLGMPREPYGFSRDARGSFGPPSFDDASFELTAEVLTQRVTVR